MARLTLLKPRLSTTAPTVRNVTTSTERTRGRAWMRIRDRVLRANPLCVHCRKAGRLAQATEVDHIHPRHLGGTDEDANLQPLCHECHATKSVAELGYTRRTQTGLDGWPLQDDPGSPTGRTKQARPPGRTRGEPQTPAHGDPGKPAGASEAGGGGQIPRSGGLETASVPPLS